MYLNALDVIILAVVMLCTIVGYNKGLIRTVYRLISFVIALFIAYQIYPYVARILRQTFLFPTLQRGIASFMNLEPRIVGYATPQGAEMIDSLPIPAILQALLHSFNTPEMFDTLNVATMEEYISGFFANIAVNGLAIVLVFVVTLIALFIIGAMLDIVSKLPIINTINRIGGAAFGIVVSGAAIWLGLVVAVLFVTSDTPVVYNALDGSWIAGLLLERTLPQLARAI